MDEAFPEKRDITSPENRDITSPEKRDITSPEKWCEPPPEKFPYMEPFMSTKTIAWSDMWSTVEVPNKGPVEYHQDSGKDGLKRGETHQVQLWKR